MELIAVALVLFVLATPLATVFLLWRQHKLRQQLLKLTELSMEVSDGLRRDLLELKRQVEASAARASSVTEAQPTQPTRHAAPQISPMAPAAPANQKPVQPVPVSSAIHLPGTASSEITPAAVPVAEKHEKEAAISASSPPIAPKPHQPLPEKPAALVPATVQKTEPMPVPRLSPAPQSAAPIEPKAPVHVATTAAPPVQKTEPLGPAAPATPAPISRSQMPSAKAPSSPVVPPQVASPTPVPPSAARVIPPPQSAAFRSPAARSRLAPSAAPPKAPVQQRMKSVFALEEILGTNWLNRLGIVLVVFGIASFGIYELGQLGPAGKVTLLYAASLALLAGGIVLEKRERYVILGRTLIGGGWALLFFTTYAINHVRAMRVMSSETTDLILMLAVALAMAAHTLRYRSQLVTGLAFLLAYGTVALSNDDVYSLASGVILAIGLVSIVIRMGWFELEVFGILSSYGNHAYWLYRLLGPEGAHGHAFPEYHASTAILLFYWITYRISYVVRKTKSPMEEHVSTAAALLNTLLLLGTMKFQSMRPELAFWALLFVGAVEFGIAQLPVVKRRREAFVVLSVLGAALMIAAVPFRYSGNNVAILWLIGGEALLAAGVVVGEVVFRRLGMLAGLLVGLHLVAIDFQGLVAVRRIGEDLALTVGVMFGLCAAVFYLNALFAGQRWKQFFNDSPDEQVLCWHSYIGGFAAASAAWALCSGDWTAIAFAGIMLTLALLGRKLRSFHLQVQYGLLGLLSLFRVVVVNLHSDVPQHTHVTNRLITLPIIGAVFYLTAKWAAKNADHNQQIFRGLFAFTGTALFTSLIYYEVPELWQPLAVIALAVLLLEVAQGIGYFALAWHAHLLTGLAILAAVTADPNGIQRWHTIPLHALGALPVVAGTYWIARRIRVPNPAHINFGRIAYSWAGTAMMAWVLNEAVPGAWIAVSWIAFAVVLALVMRKIGFKHLAWQANAVAALSLVRAFNFNLQMEQPLWPGISLRLVTISIVAAGLYFLSRKASVADSESRLIVSYLHTFAATGLLAFLAWHEAPSGWLAAVWAVFALILALVDHRFEVEELAWQAHALAALAMLRSVTINLHVVETWHGVSVRLLSLAVVVVAFYAISRIIRMPQALREQEFHHIYSWAASALVSLLMWYELQPLSVAVGWAVFGLVLFEYGRWRNTRQFRFQAYVALAASFGRIFFANLTAGAPGEFWGPRMYTVLPIVLILFFVYGQLGPDDQNSRKDRALHFDMFLAYLGTGAVVALLYFQFANEWIVTAWAVVVFTLFALVLALDRPIFLHQGLILTLGTCTRGIMHNLFGASYFTGSDWTGRYVVIGSAIALLLVCLPFAFRLRDRYKGQPSRNWLAAVVRHPEQFMFFAPVLLLTLWFAIKMRSGMVTVYWGTEGLSILIVAFLINERSYRLTGLLLLLVCFAKIVAIDMWGLEARDRYITLIFVGAAILLAHFLYTKYRGTIRQYL